MVRRTDCPYPECTGNITVEQGLAFCPSCHQPVVICKNSGCRAPNRTLAQWCRICGRALEGYRQETELQRLPQKPEQPRKVVLDETPRSVPLTYAGFLWFLTDRGTLYRMSPREEHPAVVDHLGNEFNSSSLLIAESRRTGLNGTVPFAVTASANSVLALSLTHNTRKETLATCVDNATFVIDVTQSFTGLAEHNGNIYLITRKMEGSYQLARLPITGGELTFFNLQFAAKVSGPAVFNDRVLCFSGEHVYVLYQERVQMHDWPGDFQPCLTPEDFREQRSVRPAFGAFPYFVTRVGVYVFGHQNNRPVFAVITSFAQSPVIKVVPTLETDEEDEEGIFSHFGNHPPALILKRRLRVSGAQLNFVRWYNDEEMVPSAAPLYCGNFAAARVSTQARGEFLRFYKKDQEVVSSSEYSLTRCNNYDEGVAFLMCADHLVHVFATKDRKIGMLIWEC